MMDIIKRHQNIIIAVSIIIVGFFAYTYFFTGKEEPLLGSEETPAASPDQDLISLLLELKSITLDESIFTNPTFTSLQDFGQELVSEPMGRINPFAPLDPGSVSRP